MSPEETNIWISIKHKDGQLFEQYYKDHYKFFFLAACKYLADPALAQEMVNDVFLKLWQDADSITIQVSLKSYIYRAIANRCLNQLEKNKRDYRHLQEIRHRPEETFELREMEDDELKVRLYQAIDQLPQQCRRVFRMSRVEELKQQEIADRLGISIKTVKNHITYALQQLNRVLDEWISLSLWVAVVKIFLGHH